MTIATPSLPSRRSHFRLRTKRSADALLMPLASASCAYVMRRVPSPSGMKSPDNCQCHARRQGGLPLNALTPALAGDASSFKGLGSRVLDQVPGLAGLTPGKSADKHGRWIFPNAAARRATRSLMHYAIRSGGNVQPG
jgi:hypothetical protein